MHFNSRILRTNAVLFGATVALAAPALRMMSQTSPASGALKCQVIESKTAPEVGASLAIFHQGEKADAEEVGAFLKEHDGAKVEFESTDGVWHPATVFRLKSCFGRGLLVFPAGQATLADGDRLTLRLALKTN